MITDTNRINFLLATSGQTRTDIDEAIIAAGSHEEPPKPIGAAEAGSRPPLRFCTRCQAPIDPKRVMRGSSFCGSECRRDDSRERRAFKASKACRLCGRAARPKPPVRPKEPRATDAQQN